MPPKQKIEFHGFKRPDQNWFKLPNDWMNITAGMTSLAEIKIVEYVLRHTWGYQEYGISKKITTDEFMHGRKRAEGGRLDVGTGLSKQSVIDGIKKAVKDGYLIEEVDDTDKARVKKYYRLKMDENNTEEPAEFRPVDNHPQKLDPGVKKLDTGVKNLDSWGLESSHRSEKETLDRNITVENGTLKHLKDIGQPKEKIEYIKDEILTQLGDRHSEKFYRLVAAKIPENVIRHALSEIKADGAKNPASVFTWRMQQWALTQKLGASTRA